MAAKKLKFVFLLFFGIVYSTCHAQLTTSFYMNDQNSKVAIGYEFNDRLWADFRIFSGFNFNYFKPEVVLNYNFIQRENYYTYVGGGFSANSFNSSVLVPLGIGIKPFDNLKNLSINIELIPTYYFDFQDAFIVGFVGLRYRFDE